MLRQKDISWQDIVVFGGRKVELMVARLLKPLSSLFASSLYSLFTSSSSSLFLLSSSSLSGWASSFFLYHAQILSKWHKKSLSFLHRRKISLRWTANWRQNEEGWSHSLLLPFGHRLQVSWSTNGNILSLIDSMLTPINWFALLFKIPIVCCLSVIKIQLFKWRPPPSLAK